MDTGKKNKELSDIFRSQGNTEYENGNNFEALLHYNQSLCFADEDQAALCYGNRSAVYFRLKLYRDCLNNISFARKNYPKEKMNKLEQREEKCLIQYLEELDSDQSDVDGIHNNEIFKLSYPANPKLPFFANCIELKEDSTIGPHIVTNRDLQAGDIIAIVPRFIKSIQKQSMLHHCSYCLNSSNLCLKPCPKCSNAMYCSTKCMSADMKEFHAMDCGLKTNEEGLTLTFLHFPLRALLRFLMICEGSIDKLKKLVGENEGKFYSVFDFDFSNPDDPMRDKNLLLCCLCAKVPKHLLSVEEVLQYYTEMANRHPILKNLFVTKKNRSFVGKLLQHFFGLKDQLFEGVVPYLKSSPTFEIYISFDLSPFSMLANTSCVQNIHITPIDCQRLVWRVTLPVKAGGQLIRQGLHTPGWNDLSTHERQQLHNDDFGCYCTCVACKNNWTPPSVDASMPLDSCMAYFQSPSGLKSAIGNFKMCSDFINKNYTDLNKAPSAKMLTMQYFSRLNFLLITKPALFP